MEKRIASCRCGQLHAICEGDPIRISICHCFACQQRSGSPFGMQARWITENVTINGEYHSWERTADSGNIMTYNFCPTCGGTVWYTGKPYSDLIAIPVGLFTDPTFPPPQFSIWEERKHPWVVIDAEVEHHD